MTYEYAVYIGGALAKRTLTRSRAEQINNERFNGKGTVVKQAYVVQMTFNTKGANQ